MPTKMDIYNEEQKKHRIWESIVNDFTVDDREADIAGFLMASGVDITNPKDLELLRVQNPETGEFEPIDIPLWETMDRETALGCVHSILEIIDKGGKIYNFNSLKHRDDDKIDVMEFTEDGTEHSKMELFPDPSLKAPKAVPKPGAFKMFANRVFGAFRGEINSYNRYVSKKEEYEKKIQEMSRRREFLHNYTDELTNGKTRALAVKEIKEESEDRKTFEDVLRSNAERETDGYRFKAVVAGKSNELLGRNENYRELKNKPLIKHQDLPMEGLALMAGCSIEANTDIADGSSQFGIHLSGETVPTEAEKKLFDEMAGAFNRMNIAGKVLESCYGGHDIKRMGSRAEALVKSRKMLNDAVKSYNQGDKGPLAALIKDSFPVVYETLKEMGSGTMSNGTGEAVADIADALTFLMEADPDLLRMAGITEKEIQDVRGMGRICRELQHGDDKKYKDYVNDKGPNTPERREAVEDRIFRAVLKQRVEAEKAAESDRVRGFMTNEMAKPENEEMLARYNAMEQASIGQGFVLLNSEKNRKTTRVLAEMGDKNFDMAAYREEVLEEARKTPEYQQLMSMDREQLARTDCKDIGTKVADSMAKKPKKAFPGLEASAQRSRDRAKQAPEQEQPNMDLPNL